jgi:HK97 family phage prohead protease
MPQKFVSAARFHELAKRGGATGVGLLASSTLDANGSSRIRRFRFSDGSIDLMTDRLDPLGWDLENFRRNPIVPWNHDTSISPVGRVVNIYKNSVELGGDIEFAPTEVSEFADEIFRLVAAGYVNACSVGFVPLEWSWSDDPDRPFGIDFKRQRLLEVSVVMVPALPSALIDGRSTLEFVQKRIGSAVLRARGAPAERPAPQPTTMSFSGTAESRKRQLPEATKSARHRRAAQALDLAIVYADCDTVEGRRRVAQAHKKYIEQTRRYPRNEYGV